MTASPHLNEAPAAPAGTDEVASARFTQLVTGHAQMALMFLGQVPNPQSGKAEEVNAEAAKLFIDQLEMLALKTRGNLTAEETGLLRERLNLTRLALVKAIDSPAVTGKEPPTSRGLPTPEPALNPRAGRAA